MNFDNYVINQCGQIEPFASYFGGRILSCLESEDETASLICKDVYQHLKKMAPGSMTKVREKLEIGKKEGICSLSGHTRLIGGKFDFNQ